MHSLDILVTLTGGLAVALLLGFVTQRLKISPIVGYLLAGVCVGPFTPGIVVDTRVAEQFAEIGVILLLFGVGIHFHIQDLLAVRRIAVPGAIAQIAVATALGTLVARLAGWTLGPGLVFGLAISVASTVVLLRVLSDHDALHTRAGHVAVGWLLVEDAFTVLVLVLLPLATGASGAHGPGGLAGSFGIALVKIAALVAFTLFVGQRTIPKVLGWVAKTRSRELFTLTVLVIALGIALGSATLFGASVALGAFLAGMVVGQSDFGTRAASEALPMRDAFAVLFFVSMGMLFDPTQLVANASLTLATLGVILLGKPLAALLVVLLLRHPPKTAVSVAVALAQIGEFSFILATHARQIGVLPANAAQVLVVASIASITLNPILFRLVDPASRWLSRRLRVHEVGEQDMAPQGEPADRVIVVGHGPVGSTVVRLLRDAGLEPFVIELNHETVARLRKQGVRAVYGDASQPEVLERAGAREAGSLIFTASGTPDAVIRAVKTVNPRILVLARATYVAEVPKLKDAGANVVVASEGEVALAMAERLLTQLGATREQLDRARDAVRAELASV